MAKYHFKATKSGGEIYEGEREATDKFALYHAIRAEGGTVISTKEIKERPAIFKSFSFFGRIKATDRIMFAKNLATMIDAGLPLTRALSVMDRQTRSKKFKNILSKTIAEINTGETLSSALAKFPKTFSQLFVSMVKAGEESGSLTQALKSVGDQLDKSYQLSRKIRGAMIYPAIIISIMIGIAILMLVYIVPTISATFKELKVDLPLTTRSIIFASDVVKNQWYILLGGAIAAIFTIYYVGRTTKGKRVIHAAILRIPIIGSIIKETNSARTTRTLSSLLSAGVDFLVAIRITEDVIQNVHYKDILHEASVNVEKGKAISEVFLAHEKLFPVFVGEMTSIGEETGKLGEMFSNVAFFYENEVDQKTKDMSTIIEPFLMVFIGIAVGFFAIAMLGPTYSLVDAF